MKRIKIHKKSFIILIVVLLMTYFFSPIKAYERREHDKYLREVLFKNFKMVDNDYDIADKINVLECASYLCIDQFRGNGQGDLDQLRQFGVSNIPAYISDINIDAVPNTHRSYTHRGWDYNYGSTNNKWETRKEILLNTADKLFDFNGNEKQKNSFCALVYYVHIIGDHLDDTSYKNSNGLKIDVGGRKDKIDIIHELEKHIKTVFSDQIGTHKYSSLMSSLEKYNKELYKLANSEGGINTDDKFKAKMFYTEKLSEVLTYYLPEMLKDERFFYETFYE